MTYLDKKFNKSSQSIDKSSLNISRNNISISEFGHRQLQPLTAICQSHPNQTYTNYCSNSKCLVPLCPDCIEVHLDDHKRSQLFPQIQSIKNSRVKCIRKIHKLSQMFQSQLGTIQAPKSIQKMCQDTIIRLGQIKNYMIQNIQTYFLGLQDSIKTKVQQSAAILRQLQNIHGRLRRILQQLASLDQKLHQNSQSTIPNIRKVFSLDATSLNQTFNHQLNNYGNIRKKAQIDITFDQTKFRQLLNDCIHFGIIQKSNTPISTPIRSFPSGMPPSPHSISHSQVHNRPIMEMHPYPSSYPKSDDVLIIRDQKPSSKPILHFFQSCSKNLHLYILPTLQKKTITLRSSYQIPQFHKSLFLSTNQIILTGGLINQQLKNKFIGKYDLDKKLFDDKFAIAQQRSSHSLCQMDGQVYIIGGFGREGGQRIVEKLDVRTGKVEQETPCKYGGPNVSVALSSKQIVKMSAEGIQIYHTLRKVWMPLLVPQYIYYQSSAAIDINDNQIFVFGGYIKTIPQGQKGVNCSNTFQISDKNNITIKNINQFPLPIAQGFWNNTPLIFKKQLYVLQNIQTQDSQDCIQNQRRILKFTGNKWECLT